MRSAHLILGGETDVRQHRERREGQRLPLQPGTDRANEIEPYAYLRRMLAELPKAQTFEHIEALLPWGIIARVGKIDRLRLTGSSWAWNLCLSFAWQFGVAGRSACKAWIT